MFKKKKTNRLYYPTKSSWYRKPRRRKSVYSSKKAFKHGIKTHFTRFIKNAFLYIVAGLLFVGLILFAFFSSRFSILNIDVARDNLYVDGSQVANLLKDYRGKSIFTLSKSEVRAFIQESYPEFSKVAVKKVLPNTLKVELETHEVLANLKIYYILPKAESNPLDIPESELSEALEVAFDLEVGTETEDKEQVTPVEQRGLINGIGQAIFDQEEKLELMTILVEGLSQPVEDREFVIPTIDMEYVLEASRYFINETQIDIATMTYLPIAKELHITTPSDLSLWLILDKDYKEQIDKFSSIYKIAELDKEDLKYIDLRIREKVIYCPRSASCAR